MNNLSNDELIKEVYAGIRPAPGYPAQPEHSEKATLFKLLDATDKIGVRLTENYAMWPGSSVSGFYYAHPESRYFGVGKIERDQVEDYALRKGWTMQEAERWLAPLLNYNPRAVQCSLEIWSIWGKVSGAAAGLFVGGPVGALVGALAGSFHCAIAMVIPASPSLSR